MVEGINKVAQLNVSLRTYEREMVDYKEVVFYLIEVQAGNTEWYLKKRYSDFASLDKELRTKHTQMPSLPPWTYFPLTRDADIEERRVQLARYLGELMNRVDCRTSASFRKFIEVE